MIRGEELSYKEKKLQYDVLYEARRGLELLTQTQVNLEQAGVRGADPRAVENPHRTFKSSKTHLQAALPIRRFSADAKRHFPRGLETASGNAKMLFPISGD